MKTATCILIAAASIASCNPVLAEVTATLRPPEIGPGDVARLSVNISGRKAKEPALPQVEGLRFTKTGQRSQIQIINGAMSSSLTYTYDVLAEREGVYTLPPITATVDGKREKSKPLPLRVSAHSNPTFPAPGAGSQHSSAASSARTSRSAAPNAQDQVAFLRLNLAKPKPYIGELVPVEIKAYFHEGLHATLNTLSTISGNAFTLHGLDNEPDQTRESVDGQPYKVLTWHTALSAVKEGVYPVDAQLEATLLVRNQSRRRSSPFGRGFFDDGFFDESFFSGFFGGYQEKVLRLASREQTLQIRALPAENQPSTFDGAVGTFRLSAEATPKRVRVGDPVTLHVTLEGQGNFDRLSLPEFVAEGGWKTYSPTVRFQPTDSAGFAGKKLFELALVPNSSDVTAVPSLRFSYFDPDQEQYRTIESDSLPIFVAPAPGGSSSAATSSPTVSAGAVSNDSEEDPQPTAATELAPPHLELDNTHRRLQPIYTRPLFVGSQAVVALGLVCGALLRRRR